MGITIGILVLKGMLKMFLARKDVGGVVELVYILYFVYLGFVCQTSKIPKMSIFH